MISYSYIDALFTSILDKSKGIKGRLYVIPRLGAEINSDEFEQVIGSLVNDKATKWPAALLMPPRSFGRIPEGAATRNVWERYRFIMFFLKTTYAASNNRTQDRNPHTATSMHSVAMDWEDMKRCADSFTIALAKVVKVHALHNTAIRLDKSEKTIEPVSFLGKDKVSGVRLEFSASVYNACMLEDYPAGEDWINNFVLPRGDQHPEHQL